MSAIIEGPQKIVIHLNYFEMIRNFTLKEKINYLRSKGTLTFVDGQWVFRGDPTTGVFEMSNKSRILLVENVFDILMGITVE